MHIIDERATPAQREALSRILRGEDTEPFATVFNVFASTCDRLHEPLFAASSSSSTSRAEARAKIEGVVEMRGEPILNPVTGAEHRVRIVQPHRLRIRRGRDRARLVENPWAGRL